MKKANLIWGILFWGMGFQCLSAQNTVSAEADKLKKDVCLTNAAWSFMAMYADTKDTIARHNEQMALAPASVMKMVTTAAALQMLGPDYRFKTRIYTKGNLTADGILNGDLIIRGGGDPTLGSDKWKESQKDSLTAQIHTALRKQGIKMINGNIVCDASVFEELMAPPGWNWGDIGNYYGAGPSGLSVCDNLVIYCFKSKAAGQATQVFRTIPELKDMQIRNQVTAGGSGDNAYVYGSEYGNLRFIKGTIPANSDSFCVRGNMPDPPVFAGMLIKEALEKANMPVMGKVISNRSLEVPIDYSLPEIKEIGAIKSPKLASIISVVNQFSNNLYAEHVHKAISAHKQGEGSNGSSNALIQSFWVGKGLNSSGLFITDGSGLSRSNAISTANLVKMLYIAGADKTSEVFKNSLPVAGKSGTLRNMCKGTKAEGNLTAKSGSMTRVRAYAGYVKAANGRPVIFAMTFTNFSCSSSELGKKIEALMVKMADLK